MILSNAAAMGLLTSMVVVYNFVKNWNKCLEHPQLRNFQCLFPTFAMAISFKNENNTCSVTFLLEEVYFSLTLHHIALFLIIIQHYCL